MSLNDSEELSSSEEEEEEEEESDEAEEEEEEEEEEEDSGSEVEIIEEIQGNGRLPPLQPTSVFIQEHTHFLPSLSEQQAEDFPLLTPSAEIKVMWRLNKDLSFIKTKKNAKHSVSSFFTDYYSIHCRKN